MSSNIPTIGSKPPFPPEPEEEKGNISKTKPTTDQIIAHVDSKISNRPSKHKMRAFAHAHRHPCEGTSTTTVGGPSTTTTISDTTTTTIGAPTTTTMGTPTTTTMGVPSTTTAMPPPPPKCPKPHHRK